MDPNPEDCRAKEKGDQFIYSQEGQERKRDGFTCKFILQGLFPNFFRLREACAKTKVLSGSGEKMKRSTSYDANTNASIEQELEEEAEKSRKAGCPIDPTMEYIYYQKNHVQFAR